MSTNNTPRSATLVSVTPTEDSRHTVVLTDGVHTLTACNIGPYIASAVVRYNAEQLAELYRQYCAIEEFGERISKAAV